MPHGSESSSSVTSVLHPRNKTTSEFFLSDRNMAWWAIGASLFASNIGTEHFVGQAGSAAGEEEVYSSKSVQLTGCLWGFMNGQQCTSYYCWVGSLDLSTFVVTWLQCLSTLSKGRISGVGFLICTRYGKVPRLLLSIVTLFAYILTKISSCIYAGSILLEVILGNSQVGGNGLNAYQDGTFIFLYQ